jgi:enoyl-CoA hydratase/carnithine racemase
LRNGRRIVSEMLDVHIPVVAAVNGPAVGLGATLMTLCDIVFISDSTFVADPHVANALVAGDGGAVTWPAYTSLLKVKQYLLTGDRIPAVDAVAMGLANFAVPAERVLDEAVAFAQRLASLPPQSVQDTKALLNQSLRHNAVLSLGYGIAAESQSHDTVEYAAIPDQFRQRRA